MTITFQDSLYRTAAVDSSTDTSPAFRLAQRDTVVFLMIYQRDPSDTLDDPTVVKAVDAGGTTYNFTKLAHAYHKSEISDAGVWVYYLNMANVRSWWRGAYTITWSGIRANWGYQWLAVGGGVPLDVFDGTTLEANEVDTVGDAASLDITTTQDNTMCFHCGISASGSPDVTGYTGTQLHHGTCGAYRRWAYYITKATAGDQNMEVSFAGATRIGHIIFGVREKPLATYNALTDITGGNKAVAGRFWAQGIENVMAVGDSYTLSSLHAYRMAQGIMLGWNHPSGWRGFHVPVSEGGNADIYTTTVETTGSGAEQTIQNMGDNIAQQIFHDEYYPGANIGGIKEWELNGYTNVQANGVVHRTQLMVDFYSDAATPTVVADWIKGQDIRIKPIYMYGLTGVGAGHDGMIATASFRAGSGDGTEVTGSPVTLASSYDSDLGLEDVAASESGLNLFDLEITLDTSAEANAKVHLADTAAWDAAVTNLSYIHCGYKLYRADTSGMMLATWADNSWETRHHAIEYPQDGTQKQSRDIELARWMDIMFDDKSKPLFVVMFQYADYDETLNVHEYMGWLKDICENYITQWQSVGGQAVYFLFGGTIMGDGGLGGADTAERRAQCELENEAMWRVAQERNDVYFVSLYALTGGILWDNSDTGGDQSAWAEARGWDAIANLNTTVDASAANYLDGTKVHANSLDAAFFFAWIWAEQIQADAGGAGGGGYMAASYFGLVSPPSGW